MEGILLPAIKSRKQNALNMAVEIFNRAMGEDITGMVGTKTWKTKSDTSIPSQNTNLGYQGQAFVERSLTQIQREIDSDNVQELVKELQEDHMAGDSETFKLTQEKYRSGIYKESDFLKSEQKVQQQIKSLNEQEAQMNEITNYLETQINHIQSASEGDQNYN